MLTQREKDRLQKIADRKYNIRMLLEDFKLYTPIILFSALAISELSLLIYIIYTGLNS